MFVGVLLVSLSGAHPVHTSLAEIEYQPEQRVLQISVRLFADDLCAAVGGSGEALPTDSILASYARGSFALADGQGGPLRLRWRGVERAGDMVVLRLEYDAPAGEFRRVRVLHAMLWERFSDQVNLVRVHHVRSTDTLLFTRGDSPKLVLLP